MIRNLIKVAFRNFLKERFYTFLNIAGLAVGISVALLITIFIVTELSYDRFHSKADRTFRLISDLRMGANKIRGNYVFPPLAAAINEESTEVEVAVRLLNRNGVNFKRDRTAFAEDEVLYADPKFFDVFDFKLLAGDKQTALKDQHQILLTPAIAEKYFKTSDWTKVVGQSIEVGDILYQITGIIENAPANSHFHYSAVSSMESIPRGRDETWGNMNVATYLVLREGRDINEFMSGLPDLITRNNPSYAELPAQGIEIAFEAQKMTDIHLTSAIEGEFEPNGSIATIYIFAGVALVVLLLACVNFVNLTTARSANRAKEVGVRKVLGSTSTTLLKQFTLEAIMIVAIATVFSLGIIELVRTPFSALTGRSLSFEILLEPISILILVLFVIVLGVLAGSYPSFFLARLKPASILKGKVRSGFRSSSLRNSLVTIQFVISIVLITCTFVVQNQLSYMRSKKLGFEKENVLVIRNGRQLQSQQKFIDALRQQSFVAAVGAARYRPIDDYDGTAAVTEEDHENRRLVNKGAVDYDFLNALSFELVEGRGFSRDFVSDSSAAVINESAANYLFEGEALGKKFWVGDEDGNGLEINVIGIVKDFNFQSLKSEIRPLVFLLDTDLEFIHVRLKPGDYNESIAQIQALWEKEADVSFDYAFLDESYDNLFKEESKLGSIFSIFTFLALLIACLGLLGLAAYTSEQRSKELSVRKVLGATASQIVVLLSKDFSRIVGIALILAFPIAYYAMDYWLEGYAYRAPLDIKLFVGAALSVLIVAMLAVSYQSVKAALTNPVDSLKNE